MFLFEVNAIIVAAGLMNMKNVCPDKYCTSELSRWEGEAIILDKVTV